MSGDGRKSRATRLKIGPPPAVYPSAALRWLQVIKGEFRKSKKADDGANFYPILCIPPLLSCLRLLTLEVENHKEGLIPGYKSGLLFSLQRNFSKNDISQILEFYKADATLKEEFKVLLEVRHEIIHPAPFSENYSNTSPTYLSYLKDYQLIWLPPDDCENFACNIYMHFSCHKLFAWSFQKSTQLSRYILESKPTLKRFSHKIFQEFLKND